MSTSTTEKSFFSRIAGFFKSSFEGRYIGSILSEVSKDHQEIVKIITGMPDRDLELIPEFQFRVNSKRRIADLAAVNRHSKEVVALIEIKCDDKNNPGNAEQLDDYFKFCLTEKITFICLTKHSLPINIESEIKRNGFSIKFLSEIANDLLKNKQKNSGLIKLLLDYFKDRGMVMMDIDDVVIGKMMARFFNPAAGHGRIQSNEDFVKKIPEAFSALMGNMEIISSSISQIVNRKSSNKQPSIDFWLTPYFNEKVKPSKSDGVVTIETKHRNGGTLFILARQSIGASKEPWCQFEYGLAIDISKGEKIPSCRLYSQIHGGFSKTIGEETWNEKNVSLSSFSNKEKSEKTFKYLISLSIDNAIESKTIPKETLKTLKEIKSSIT